jgi:predicted nucleotidyltransferase
MHSEGLDAEGYIAREGSLSRVRPEFTAVVDRARTLIADTFDITRMHSAYLYGSIPRGTATPGTSDLDLLIALHGEPSDRDRLDADRLAADIDAAFDQINGAGIELAIFGHYYPDRAQQMRLAASIARTPATDPALLDLIIEDLAVWLATEYRTVHGAKTPRT